MNRSNQSERIGQLEEASAVARSAREVTHSEHNRGHNGRLSTRTDELKSERAKDIGKLRLVPIAGLHPDPRNPRRHSRIQVRAIARSIEAFGFNAPVLVDKRNQIVAGHGRYEAAQLLGLENIP
jgi:hypothetical protein